MRTKHGIMNHPLRLAALALALGAAVLVSPVPEHRAEAETVQSCRRKGCKLNINTYRCICPRKRPRLSAARRCRRMRCRYDYRRRRCDCSTTAARRVTPRRRAARPTGKRNRRTGIRWVTIPGGSFDIGAKRHTRMIPKGPRVTVPTFQLSRTEVTVSQYRRCVRARICAKPTRGRGCTYHQSRSANLPVNCVSWHDARTYARWVGGRLPSESEWEFAARSRGKDLKYPWGKARPSCKLVSMSLTKCRIKQPQAVCRRPAGNTEQGLCDMAGNVWEWTEDMYRATYKGVPVDGTARKTPASRHRMIRGGSYTQMESNIRTRYRSSKQTNQRKAYIGIRVARNKP